MKVSFILSTLLTLATITAHADDSLPTLNVIQNATLVGSFLEPNSQSLYLSEVSKLGDNPDLFLMRIQGKIQMQSAPRGGSSVIADLGSVDLREATARRVMYGQDGSPSQFVRNPEIFEGHTYAVLMVSPTVQGLFAFTVKSIGGDVVKIQYAVLSYTITKVIERSEGWNPDAKNSDGSEHALSLRLPAVHYPELKNYKVKSKNPRVSQLR